MDDSKKMLVRFKDETIFIKLRFMKDDSIIYEYSDNNLTWDDNLKYFDISEEFKYYLNNTTLIYEKAEKGWSEFIVGMDD